MKKIKQIMAAMLLCIGMLMMTFNAFADGEAVSVSVDNSEVLVGDTVTVTVTASSSSEIYGGTYEVYVNGTAIGSVDFDSDEPATSITKTFSFTASEEGTYTVSLPDTVQLVVISGEEMVSATATPNSVTVNATAPTTPAPTPTPTPTPSPTPTPEPSPTPTPSPTPVPATITGIEVEYVGGEKRVGENVAGIELSILAVYDDGTKQAVNGWTCDQVGQALVAGENVFVINYQGFSTQLIVNAVAEETSSSEESTAESSEESTSESTEETTEEETSGTEKIPYIQVSSPFGGDDLYLASDWSVDVPDGFEADSITYGGYDVKVVKNESGLTLVYMTDREGNNGDFYIYDEDTGKFSYYTGIPVSGTTYYILSIPDDFDSTGLTKMTLSINGNTLDAYQLSDSDAEGIVCLVYAVDADGNKGYYRFDTSLKTFVRYYPDSSREEETEPVDEEDSTSEEQDVVSAEKYEELAQEYYNDSWLKFYIIIALIVLAVILFIFVIILAMKLKKIYNEYDFVDDVDSEEETEEDGYEYDDDGVTLEDEDAEQAAAYDEDFRVDLSGITDDDDEL